MKKNYKKPSCELVRIETDAIMLFGSFTGEGAGVGGETDVFGAPPRRKRPPIYYYYYLEEEEMEDEYYSSSRRF